MAERTKGHELKNTSYELFILLLSLVSIVNLALIYLEGFVFVDQNVLDTVEIIDIILTGFFLYDFGLRLFTAPSKSAYFFKGRGWADFLACVPLLRIFRLFRVVRAVRLMRDFGLKHMIDEIVNDRAGSALYITVFFVIVLAEAAAILILKAEAYNPNANITSAGDAVWWVFVTITTVGYGDKYPTTGWGRVIGVVVMLCGIALLGVITSYLANFFIAPSKKKAAPVAPDDPKAKLAQLTALLDEQEKANAALRQKIGEMVGQL